MRLILTILLIGLFKADAQMVVNASAPYRASAVAVTNLLLDDYPNAAAAYSLRKLRTAYTGAAIRVRKDTTGQPENDIGFTASGELDTASLKSFLNARSGFVTTWYDQIGNIRNISQTNDAIQTTQANQPRIALNGVIDRDNGKPCIVFDGSNDWLGTASSVSPTAENRVITDDDFSIFGVASAAAQQNRSILSQHSGVTGRIIFLNTDNGTTPFDQLTLFFNNGTSYSIFSTTIAFDGTQKLLYSEMNGSGTSHVRVNGGNAEGTLNNQTLTPANIRLQIGSAANGTGNFFNGKTQEFVLYQPNQSSNRAAIRDNINTYYGIY